MCVRERVILSCRCKSIVVRLQESAREREREYCALSCTSLPRHRTVVVVARTVAVAVVACISSSSPLARACCRRLLCAVVVVARKSGVLGLRWPSIDGRIQQPTESRLRR